MGTSNPNISGLPPDLQAIIRKAVADALAAAAPPPPKELTPQERAEQLLTQIATYERGDRAVASGSGATHQAIADVLAILVKQVFTAPADSGSNAPTTTQAGASTPAAPVAEATGV